MTSQVTQCPKCHTSFRVTETQLNIANGAVRCGSCLHIFDAPDHWLSNTNTTAPAKPCYQANDPPATNTDLDIGIDAYLEDDTDFGTDTEKEAEIEGNFDIGRDNDIDENQLFNDTGELLVKEAVANQPKHVDQSSAPKSIDENEEQEPLPSIIVDDEDDDVSFINDDLPLNKGVSPKQSRHFNKDIASYDELDLSVAPNAGTNEFSESFLSLKEKETKHTIAYKDLDVLGNIAEPDEESWAEKLLDDTQVDDEDEQVDPFEETPNIFDSLKELDDPEMDPNLDDILNIGDEDYLVPSSNAEDELVINNEPMLAGDPIGSNKHSLLANIEPEPVVISFKKDRSHWAKNCWILLIITTVLALGVQYTAFNFERLSRDKQARPLLNIACQWVGCTVPDMDDIRLISSSNLMVRSHPTENLALVVDAIITNRANFKQRFPIMELQFTDLAGNIVAGRRFQPEQYLAGELTGANIMPSRQPIHISLEIVDPGQEAVNYQLYFHPKRDG